MKYKNLTKIEDNFIELYSDNIVSADVVLDQAFTLEKDKTVYICTYRTLFNAMWGLTPDEKAEAIFYITSGIGKDKDSALKDLKALGYKYFKEIKNEKDGKTAGWQRKQKGL